MSYSHYLPMLPFMGEYWVKNELVKQEEMGIGACFAKKEEFM